MHLQITNEMTLALDAFRIRFESAGALELPIEYSIKFARQVNQSHKEVGQRQS